MLYPSAFKHSNQDVKSLMWWWLLRIVKPEFHIIANIFLIVPRWYSMSTNWELQIFILFNKFNDNVLMVKVNTIIIYNFTFTFFTPHILFNVFFRKVSNFYNKFGLKNLNLKINKNLMCTGLWTLMNFYWSKNWRLSLINYSVKFTRISNWDIVG